MKRILFFAAAWMLLALGARAEGNVPSVVNFQSVLTDDCGNLLPDGAHTVYFRILDASEQPLYEEKQTVESVKGVVSAMVGAGVELGTVVPTGGLLPEELVPGVARFLSVEVEGMPVQTLEINSVPYSMYSQQSLSVAEKSIR